MGPHGRSILVRVGAIPSVDRSRSATVNPTSSAALAAATVRVPKNWFRVNFIFGEFVPGREGGQARIVQYWADSAGHPGRCSWRLNLADEGWTVRELPPGSPAQPFVVSRSSSFALRPKPAPGEYELRVSVGDVSGTPCLARPLVARDSQHRYVLGKVKVGRWLPPAPALPVMAPGRGPMPVPTLATVSVVRVAVATGVPKEPRGRLPMARAFASPGQNIPLA